MQKQPKYPKCGVTKYHPNTGGKLRLATNVEICDYTLASVSKHSFLRVQDTGYVCFASQLSQRCWKPNSKVQHFQSRCNRRDREYIHHEASCVDDVANGIDGKQGEVNLVQPYSGYADLDTNARIWWWSFESLCTIWNCGYMHAICTDDQNAWADPSILLTFRITLSTERKNHFSAHQIAPDFMLQTLDQYTFAALNRKQVDTSHINIRCGCTSDRHHKKMVTRFFVTSSRRFSLQNFKNVVQSRQLTHL